MLTWMAIKAPNENKDYQIDWTSLLGEDTISESSWTVTSGEGLVIGEDSYEDGTTTVWLSEGTADKTYDVCNLITTLGGRTYQQTVRLRVRIK